MFHLQSYTYIIHSVCVYCVSQLYVSVEEAAKSMPKTYVTAFH